MEMQRIIKILLSAFIFNFLWEISQAFLYAPHFSGTLNFISIHLMASLGDVLLVSFILIADMFLIRRLLGKEYGWKRILGLMIVGLAVGVAVEKYALATGRWQYGNLMPIIPILQVGLAPILQMMLIPPLAILLNSKFES